MNIKFHISKNY